MYRPYVKWKFNVRNFYYVPLAAAKNIRTRKVLVIFCVLTVTAMHIVAILHLRSGADATDNLE